MLHIEDFAKIDLTEVRRRVGRKRKLRVLAEVLVTLADGRQVVVPLMRSRANIGHGTEVDFSCPGCGMRVRVLRVIPGGEGLVCRRCLQRRFGARYRCQDPYLLREDRDSPANL